MKKNLTFNFMSVLLLLTVLFLGSCTADIKGNTPDNASSDLNETYLEEGKDLKAKWWEGIQTLNGEKTSASEISFSGTLSDDL